MTVKKRLFALLPLLAALYIGWHAFAATSPQNLPDPPAETAVAGPQTIVLGGGCFWGIEAVFRHVKGVQSAVSGYAGGTADTATYKQVSRGETTHAEVVQITYDPAQVTLGQLLKIFFSVAHDPTQLNRQGPDTGPQYRSEIFFTTPEQEKTARDYIAQLDAAGAFPRPIVTKVTPLETFYPAEAYHQNYAALNPDQPYIVIHDRPKVEALKQSFPALFRSPLTP
jgi:peptide-methionine (S)-S-oxide reductase